MKRNFLDNKQLKKHIKKIQRKNLLFYLSPIKNINEKILIAYLNNLCKQIDNLKFNLGTEETER